MSIFLFCIIDLFLLIPSPCIFLCTDLYNYLYHNIYTFYSMYLPSFIYIYVYFAKCPIRSVKLLSAIFTPKPQIFSFCSQRFSYRILHSSALVKILCSLDLWQSVSWDFISLSFYMTPLFITSHVFLFLNFLSCCAQYASTKIYFPGGQ